MRAMNIWPRDERATETITYRVSPQVKARLNELKKRLGAKSMAALHADGLSFYAEAAFAHLEHGALPILRYPDEPGAPEERTLPIPWESTAPKKEDVVAEEPATGCKPEPAPEPAPIPLRAPAPRPPAPEPEPPPPPKMADPSDAPFKDPHINSLWIAGDHVEITRFNRGISVMRALREPYFRGFEFCPAGGSKGSPPGLVFQIGDKIVFTSEGPP